MAISERLGHQILQRQAELVRGPLVSTERVDLRHPSTCRDGSSLRTAGTDGQLGNTDFARLAGWEQIHLGLGRDDDSHADS